MADEKTRPPKTRPTGKLKIGGYVVDRTFPSAENRTVALAYDEVSGMPVVLKGIHDADKGRAILNHERYMLAFLNSPELHPHICHLADPKILYDTDGEPFLVLAYGGEYTLDRFYQATTQFRGAALAQALKGITFTHERGIIHRDIKPNNIVVNGATKIIDYEAADFINYSLHPLRGFATPRYASPRQMDNEDPTTKDDVFSAAATALVVLRGSSEPPPYRLVPDGKGSVRPDFDQPLYSERDVEPYGKFGELILKGLSVDVGQRPSALEMYETAVKQFGESFPDPFGGSSIDIRLRSSVEIGHASPPISPYVAATYRKSGPPLEGRVESA